jgi:hypothetical protein
MADFEEHERVGDHQQYRCGSGDGEVVIQAALWRAPQPPTAAPAQQLTVGEKFAGKAVDLATVAAGDEQWSHARWYSLSKRRLDRAAHTSGGAGGMRAQWPSGPMT